MSDTIKRFEAMEALQREILGQLQVAQATINRQGMEINKLYANHTEQCTAAAKREFTLVQQKQEINELYVQASQQWTAIDKLESTIAEQGTTIDKLESTIAEQGTVISKQGTVISKQGTVIAEQGTVIAEQGIVVAEQGTVIAEQGVEINELRLEIASDVRQEEDLLGVAITRIRERAKTYTPLIATGIAEAIIRCVCPSGVVFLCDLQKDARNWLDTPNRNETLSAHLQFVARPPFLGRLPILESFARGRERVDRNGNVFYKIHRDMFPN